MRRLGLVPNGEIGAARAHRRARVPVVEDDGSVSMELQGSVRHPAFRPFCDISPTAHLHSGLAAGDFLLYSTSNVQDSILHKQSAKQDPPRLTMNFPIPPNEVERLQALRRLEILDGALPPGLDRICSVAQNLFRVPVVLMVFLDEDIAWIKHGAAPGLSEAPRNLSFCNHTIMHDEVFVVPDAHMDGRFVDHPHVKADPPLRFYAGAPFTVETGVRIGSICIVDHVPRDFTPKEMSLLSGLARIAVDELWLRYIERTGMVPMTGMLPPQRPCLDFQHEPAITGKQVRAGRGLLNWSVRQLAEAAGVSPMTVKRIEGSDDVLAVRDRSANAVRRALEEAGVVFVFDVGAQPGVRPR
jgi:hypothetical protein